MTNDIVLDKMNLTALHSLRSTSLHALASAKETVSLVDQEVMRRFGESVARSLADAGKEHGSISLPLQDGFVAKGDIKRTVKWDSAALQAVAQTLPWERVAAIFKIEFSVPETIYKGIAALSPELREKIDAARTVKFAPPAVTLEREA